MTNPPNNPHPFDDPALLQREAELQAALEAAYAGVAADLRARLVALQARGGSAFEQARLPELIHQVDARLAVFARVATALISDAQRDAAVLAGEHTHAQIQAGIGAPAGVSVTLRRLPIEAIEQLVGRTFDGSPLSSLLGTLAPETATTVRQALLSGLAAGDGPRAIARTFAGAIDGGYARAELIARTEVLGAYRSAALANYRANSDVVDEWEWSADSAACDECLTKDGNRYPLTAPFDEHPNGRCAPIPVTKSWADLGILMSDDPDEAAWEQAERAIWEQVSFDYTTQPRDAQGRWAPGEGSAEKKAMQGAHRQARASLRATHAEQRASLRAQHTAERNATQRGMRHTLDDRHRAERAELRADHAEARARMSEAHAAQREALTNPDDLFGRDYEARQQVLQDREQAREIVRQSREDFFKAQMASTPTVAPPPKIKAATIAPATARAAHDALPETYAELDQSLSRVKMSQGGWNQPMSGAQQSYLGSLVERARLNTAEGSALRSVADELAHATKNGTLTKWESSQFIDALKQPKPFGTLANTALREVRTGSADAPWRAMLALPSFRTSLISTALTREAVAEGLPFSAAHFVRTFRSRWLS